ncbi:uncharacterized protein LOC123528709 [Mercenaria mercenaria]|uniref:uncharacterized protein LOC123528709 n=1 Tax=Mercenaria mercenaria TaxID=6596 RepID=UPI00234EC369|nr:uncharacterized protein LOC123528709 [Mercenaria mercenaria]
MSRYTAPTKKLAEKWRRPSVSDDITVCNICNNNLKEPRTLPCMHSFCEECLFVLLKCYETQKKLDRTFFCPTCKVRTPCHILGKVSVDWLRMFPKKHVIDKMKEAILVVEEMCQPCSTSWKVIPATTFCVECREYMCAACTVDHKANGKSKLHKVVDYEVKEMKNTPVSNISKFQCKQHSSLRYTSFCEIHQIYLCNTCKDSVAHRQCRVTQRLIEATGNITKAETKLNVLNSLRRDERNKGKQLLKLIEQIDQIQDKLEKCRQKQVESYCNYVMQASITEQKTEAIDALKGKVEFVKTYQSHATINNTINKVEDILIGYTNAFADIVDADEKAVKMEITKGIADIEKVLSKPAFDAFDSKSQNEMSALEASNKVKLGNVIKIPIGNITRERERVTVTVNENVVEEETLHMCKKHVDDTLDEETFTRLGGVLQSVGAICFKTMSATAFRVGSKYVMTAAHTVRDIVDPDRSGKSDWSSLEDTGVYLTFASPTLNADSKRFHFTQLVSFLDDELNVAILEIVDVDDLPPPVILSRKDIEAVKVNEVAVIGYGHKGTHSKHLDIKCQLVTPESDRATKALKWLKLEERKHRCNLLVRQKDPTAVYWHYDEMKASYNVTIDCCMEYRAQGAPVITNSGPSGAEVLAIVTRSLPECFLDLPKKTQDRCIEYRFEAATKMSSLYERLITETRVLADDIFVKDKNYFNLGTFDTFSVSSPGFATSTPRSSQISTSNSSDVETLRTSAISDL